MQALTVSILVVLDDWFGHQIEVTETGDAIMFQSLLFWMIGSGPNADECTLHVLGGFNPCCFG